MLPINEEDLETKTNSSTIGATQPKKGMIIFSAILLISSGIETPID
jgi:hypothetical protein